MGSENTVPTMPETAGVLDACFSLIPLKLLEEDQLCEQ